MKNKTNAWKTAALIAIGITMLLATVAGALALDTWELTGRGSTTSNYSGTQGFAQFTYEYLNRTDSQFYNMTYGGVVSGVYVYRRPDLTTGQNPRIFNDSFATDLAAEGFLLTHLGDNNPVGSGSFDPIVRWTAPRDGTYNLNISIGIWVTGSAGDGFEVFIKNSNGTTYLDVNMTTSANTRKGINLTLDMVAGQSIYFKEQNTSTNYGYDAAGIKYFIYEQPGATPVPAPTWVTPTPDDASSNNTQVTLNASCSPGNTTYMWFDSSNPPTTLVLSGTTLGNYTTNVGASTTTYYYIAACNSAGEFSTNTSTRSWTYDAVFPAIILNANNAFNSDNYSTENQFDDTAFLNLTFTDDHALYAMEVNVTAPNGSSVYDKVQTNLSGTNYLFQALLNTSIWPVGNYNFELFVSDSHTKNEIKPYDVIKDNKKLEFKTAEGKDITISTDDDASIAATKKTDKYEFSFDFSDKQFKKRVFNIEATTPIIYLPDSSYKGHFVVYSDHDGNWIDFEGVPGTPDIKKINDYHYQVTFQNMKSAKFKSIGGLNVYTANFTWYRGNYTETSPATASATEPTTLNLIVSKGGGISDMDAGLTYNTTIESGITKTSNSTAFIFTKTLTAPNASATISYTWNVTVRQGDGSLSQFNVTKSQTIAFFGIDACTASTTQTMNITIYNEDIPTQPIISTISIEITAWQTNKSNSRFFSTNLSGQSSYKLCIFPSYGNVSADIYIQNTANLSLTHRYYVFNGFFNNESQNISLYNFISGTTGLSDLRITTRNLSTYQYFPNVVAKLQRRYLSEGLWRTVQMDKSGDFGLVDFDIKERSIDYRLIFLDTANNVLKTTDSLKFACTDSICDLTQLLNPAGEGAEALPTTVNVSYINNTGLIIANWTNPEGNTVIVNFIVTRETGSSSTTICSSAQTGSAGTIQCNASGLTGTARYSFKSDGSLIESAFISLSGASLGSKVGDVEGALWAVAIIVTIVMVGLFSPVGSVIGAIIGLVFVNLLGIFTPLTLTFILIAAVIGVIIGVKVKQ